MDSLVFALIAVRSLYNRQEPVIAETESLPAFDFQSLRYVYAATERSARQATGRNDSHVAQAVS
jgi:hypothetical protein